MFIPPHCPNLDCDNYQNPNNPRWYHSNGQYTTKLSGNIQRYRCNGCHTSFSHQTFSIDYFAKKHLDYQYIYKKINDGAGIRKIARDLNVRPKAITNRINRMARNATLINQQIVNQLPFKEDLVLDGLQNFCVSQFFPDNYTIVVGKDSQFVYDCDYATIRRGGTMTSIQKKRRVELEKRYRAPRKSIEHSFTRVLKTISQNNTDRVTPIILYTDEKTDYRRALWGDLENREKMFSGQWRHHMTNSKVGRNTRNPLFSVNYIDREIRKDMASQARETVQFPRNVSNAMLRMSLYLFDHNVRKPYRINDVEKRKLKHAQVAGLDERILETLLEGFFTHRCFKPGGLRQSLSAQMTLGREWITPLKRRPEKLWNYLAA
jgi:transposase-like protein